MIMAYLRRGFLAPLRRLATFEKPALPAAEFFYHSTTDRFCNIHKWSPMLSQHPEISGKCRHYCEMAQSKNHLRNSELYVACWRCKEGKPPADALPFLVCAACGAVQPLDTSIDYFKIFGIKRKCEIRVEDDLEGRYKMWQKKLHPDLVHSKSQKEKEFASDQSAMVIEAYRTLSNPLSRAIYILRLEGVEINEEETLTDPELLTEIMEIREAVEEASDPNSLRNLQSEVTEFRKLNVVSRSLHCSSVIADEREIRIVV